MSVLVPCPGCSRHVRASEATCPFCAADLPSDLASRAVPAANRRLSRVATFTFATTIAVAAVGVTAACSSSSDTSNCCPPYGAAPPTDGSVDDGGGAQPLYGLPADASVAPDDGGGAQPLYGLPPEDSGIDTD